MKKYSAFLILAVLFASSCVPPPQYRRTTRSSWRGFRAPQSGDRIVITARRYLGVPYRYGGTTPRGFDCSGFVYYVYRKSGMPVKRNMASQYREGKRVSKHRLQPGDLVFFQTSGRRVSHVGIYAGSGRFIHAPRTGKSVSYAKLNNPYWKRRYRGGVSYLSSKKRSSKRKRPSLFRRERNTGDFTETVHYF